MSASLLHINVSDHVEKKNGLSYLSWACAWAEVLKIDPAATWEAVEYQGADGYAMPCMYLRDGSAMVKVVVTILGNQKQSILPVMDHKNKAITNPDAFAINKNIMRCLAKAVGMHGLGLYIYAGEDLPEIDYVFAVSSARDDAALKSAFAASWKMSSESEKPAIKAAYDARKASIAALATAAPETKESQ